MYFFSHISTSLLSPHYTWQRGQPTSVRADQEEGDGFPSSNLSFQWHSLHFRVAQIVADWQPGCEKMERQWENANDHPEGLCDGIGDSSSWVKIAFFLCKTRLRTNMFIIWGQKQTKKNHEKLTVSWGGGLMFMVSLSVKYLGGFWRLPMLKSTPPPVCDGCD